jgi:NTE family protein
MADVFTQPISKIFPKIPRGLLPPKLRVGVAFGGGAARAFAHIGVLRTLLRADIPVHIVTGCSMGAIIGGGYAASLDVDETERRMLAYVEGEAFRGKALDIFRGTRDPADRFSLMRFLKRGIYYGRMFFKASFFTMEEFRQAVEGIVPDVSIEDLKVPFACNAAHLKTGEERIFDKGLLRPAVMASSAIPGIFPPVPIGEDAYIDGGWVDPIPVRAARALGADFVIAVDVSYRIRTAAEYQRGFSLVNRGVEIKTHRLIELSRSLADAVVRVDVDDIAWADFVRAREIIVRGEEAALKTVDEMSTKIWREKWKKRIPFRDQLLKLLK